MELKGQTALVTGSAKGIGRAAALALAGAGANVVINYAHDEEAAKRLESQCQALGADTLCIQTDVSREDEVDGMFDAIAERFGGLQILVNNAGITRDGLVLRMKPEDFDRVLDVNLKGAFLCCKKASRMMLRAKYGRIINVASVVGLRGNAGQVNYASAKAGLIGLTKSLAKELASRNITVNAVAPGMVRTDMTSVLPEKTRQAMIAQIPAGRAADPEEVAHAIAFFASPESGYITGQVLAVDGGMAV